MTLSHPIIFTVHGEPKPAGSKRAFVLQRPGFKPRAIVTDANANSKDWKSDVRAAALAALNGARPLLAGAIAVKFTFYRLRPKAHFRTGKNAALMRDDAPRFPLPKPDVLKLARGVEDALTGIVWQDDAQIVEEHLFKHYGEKPGVVVEIWEL